MFISPQGMDFGGELSSPEDWVKKEKPKRNEAKDALKRRLSSLINSTSQIDEVYVTSKDPRDLFTYPTAYEVSYISKSGATKSFKLFSSGEVEIKDKKVQYDKALYHKAQDVLKRLKEEKENKKYQNLLDYLD